MQTQLTHYQQRVQTKLQQLLSDKRIFHANVPTTLIDALEYATLNNGKRLRPALIYATGEALDIPLDRLDSAACAIELIHSYSLVHDDLPAMDDDDLRRGRPTCHIQYDEATAILVGDAQQTLAFEVLSHDPTLQDQHKLRLIQLLSRASGVSGMIGGQMIDMQSEDQTLNLKRLETLHAMKTGALIKTALLMGAAQSHRFDNLNSSLCKLGDLIGLAFQVQDDILDIEGDTQTLGKPQGSDLESKKSTYPKLMGLEESKRYRDDLIRQSKEELAALKIHSPFLLQLTEYIAQRTH